MEDLSAHRTQREKRLPAAGTLSREPGSLPSGIFLILRRFSPSRWTSRPSGVRNPTRPEREEATRSEDISVFPLAFPPVAGPRALTSVVLLVGGAGTPLALAGILIALAVVLVLTLAALIASRYVMRILGVTGTNVVGRVLGIILAALASQYTVDGIAEIMQRSP